MVDLCPFPGYQGNFSLPSSMQRSNNDHHKNEKCYVNKRFRISCRM